MTYDMTGKVAVITGGNSGIGRSVVLGFAKAGAKVVIAARDTQKGEEALQMVHALGGEGIFVKTDVSRSEEVDRLFDITVDTYGRLDFGVNNAAIERQKEFLEWSEADWDELIDINLKGVWLCMKRQISQMLKQGGGAIVNVSSVAGLIGVPLHGPYIASKHGVLGLTRSASVEFAAKGIRVNTVSPGTIMTPMLEHGFSNNRENAQLAVDLTPMARIGQPDELAAAVLWLCSNESSYISGINLSVDGGWSQH